jgi:hypothetical protein
MIMIHTRENQKTVTKYLVQNDRHWIMIKANGEIGQMRDTDKQSKLCQYINHGKAR